MNSSSADKDDVVLALLKDLIHDFDSAAGTSGRAMRQLLSQEPMAFRAAAIQALIEDEQSAGSHYLLRVMMGEGMLIDPLWDPNMTRLESAVALARRAARVNPLLDVMLAERIPLVEGAARTRSCDLATARILEILAAISSGQRILPVLMQLLDCFDARVHSKAILLLVRSRRDERWISRVLSHSDWRVRANAVEALWDARYPWLAAQFLRASKDPHNRVAANALVGLYKLGHMAAPDCLRKMAESNQELDRASAVWAMGETGDEQFAPVLREIARAGSGSVRVQALRALVRIRKANQTASA